MSAFRTIYADPPWPYENEGATRGGIKDHYGTTSMTDLEAMPVASLAHPDGCILWMWATWPKMRDGLHLRLLAAWGFEWKSELVWDKQKYGVGHWLRKQTEILIVASRGGARLKQKNERDLLSVPRSEHSSKPWQVYEIIERASEGPYLEMFARTEGELVPRRSGWHFWGNQADLRMPLGELAKVGEVIRAAEVLGGGQLVVFPRK